LQVFFIGTSIYGWRLWAGSSRAAQLPVTRVPLTGLAGALGTALLVSVAYGYWLKHFTNAYAPFVDSLVLTLSVLGQLLLIKRRYETWWVWIFVNTLSILLFGSRGLWITAALYTAYWVNAVFASLSWRRWIVAP